MATRGPLRKKFETISDFGPLRMRLQRFGRKNDAFYNIVVAQARNRRNGKVHDVLGSYYPHANDQNYKHINLDFSKAKSWIAVGAEPTSMVSKLLSKAGILPSPPKSIEYALNSSKRKIMEDSLF